MDLRAEVEAFLASLAHSPRVRDDTLKAILTLRDAGSGTLVLRVPRSSGQPIDGAVIQGGLQLRLFEDREIA